MQEVFFQLTLMFLIKLNQPMIRESHQLVFLLLPILGNMLDVSIHVHLLIRLIVLYLLALQHNVFFLQLEQIRWLSHAELVAGHDFEQLAPRIIT